VPLVPPPVPPAPLALWLESGTLARKFGQQCHPWARTLWRIVASNGQTLAVSENYVAKASAKSAVESVIKNAAGATVVDLT